MPLAQKKIELVIHPWKKFTTVTELKALVATAGTAVLASCSYEDRDGTVVLLVPDDPVRASHVLNRAGIHYSTNAVVLVGPHIQPAMAVRLGCAFAQAGISVHRSYVSWSTSRQGYFVFKTTDDDRAVHVATTSLSATTQSIPPSQAA